MGIMYAPISSIRVVLEEKSPADFYKMMLKGECPPCMAFVFRKMLYQSDADFEQVKELSQVGARLRDDERVARRVDDEARIR